ncbi:TrkA domain protein [hydrothermal vent metagenome]|uniref:TrkA domain protein n=1 Tax=hydrothermal vent metagenome TaxID=652676 RepID=A0A1W1BFM5_9ZZZZ
MKHILILADGPVAKQFLEWINKTRIVDNQYHVACYKDGVLPDKANRIISTCHTDPTSYSKLLAIMSKVNYSMVFVIMESREDTQYTVKNIRQIDSKIRVVLLNKWEDNYDDIDNLTVIDEYHLVATHLYDHLPNVPVIAKNVGLGEGEIMEMIVPFGSNYAYRHIGSIAQRKWKIAAIYRNKKQILPTSATMIYPNDTLLVLGKPMVLDGVYKSINKRIGLFPEPFGKDLYLLLDFDKDIDRAIIYLQESIYLADRLEGKKLYVRIINPSNFNLLEALKEEERENVSIHICYDVKGIEELVEYDIQSFDIGLVMNSVDTFDGIGIMDRLYQLKKLIYIFGDKSLYDITQSVVLITNESEMESISSTAIDFSKSLELELHLCDFDPEGDFDSKKMIVEHYETLSQIFNYKIYADQDVANPVRMLQSMNNIIQISPFTQETKRKSIFNLISTKVQDYLLTIGKHPKILVPVEFSENI